MCVSFEILGILISLTDFEKMVRKARFNSLSVETTSFPSVRFIFPFLRSLFEYSRTTVFVKCSVISDFLISRLLKCVFLVFFKNFLQKLRCDIYVFLSEKVLNLHINSSSVSVTSLLKNCVLLNKNPNV